MQFNEVLVQDLSHLANNGELEPAYGRTSEMLLILETLALQQARNILLVGHRGVGKKRIVEGLAVAGSRGETEDFLEKIRIIKLEIGVLSSGRQEWEDRLIGKLFTSATP